MCHYLRWEATVAGEAEPLGLEGGLIDRSPSYFIADPGDWRRVGGVWIFLNDCP